MNRVVELEEMRPILFSWPDFVLVAFVLLLVLKHAPSFVVECGDALTTSPSEIELRRKAYSLLYDH